MSKEYLRIGKILRPQGIRGEMKLEILSQDPGRFEGLHEAYLEKPVESVGDSRNTVTAREAPEYTKCVLLSSALRGQNAYIRLHGCASREDAEKLRDAYLCLKREDLPPLPAGRWYIDDLIGCWVTDSDKREWGNLVDILQYGAADVYVVQQENGAEMMFPALKTLLQDVNIQSKTILLDANVLAQVAVWDEYRL